MNEEHKSGQDFILKRLFRWLASQKVGFWPLSIIFLFTIGAFVVVQSMLYHNIFEPRHTETRQFMLDRVRNDLQQITSKIEYVLLERSSHQKELQAALDSLNARLITLATHLTDVAIADRSNSLDNIFERFSMLVAVVALIFGGFGIFATLQYRDQLKQMRSDLTMVRTEYLKKLEQSQQEFEQKAEGANRRLSDAIYKSMDMIWLVGNHLEQLLNLDIIEREKAEKFLKDIYLTGFRLALYSNIEEERISALHNLYAQGNCDDLVDLIRLYFSENELKNIRELAWRTIQNILKQCSHKDKHSQLFHNANGVLPASISRSST
ncbi:MAG: hypothetical protein Q9P14_17835 [candidate division KSB1 bacterium]|nr:hypothetical protein [candidate division KSB1 bacterium]MDQ7066459.1 hypothetical protein [candidate division KSB1 bacterium]